MRLVSLTLALLAAGAVAGCGDAHPSRGGSSAGAPLASRSRPLTVREAQKLVHAVGLKAADVPGFAAAQKNPPHSARERALELQVRRCAGGIGARGALAEASSENFEQRAGLARQSVSSEVSVAPSAAIAAKELAQASGAHVRACLARYLDALLAGNRSHGLSFLPVRIQHATPPAAGATGSFALRITSAIAGQGASIPLYFDVLGFVDGPVQVSLTTFGFPLPFTASTAERLFTLLLRRTETYTPDKS